MTSRSVRACGPTTAGVLSAVALACATVALPAAAATTGPAQVPAAAPQGAAATATVPPDQVNRARQRTSFDLEGHRGTRGLRPEDTLPAFAKALDIGVRTLELDTGVTKDGVVIVSHERSIAPLVCTDTAPVVPGDPQFPYVGKTYHELTFAQVETVDCGSRHPTNPATDPYFASQLPVPGTRIPTLDQVFALVEQRHAAGVQLNIETKIDPTQPQQTLAPEAFTRADLAVIWRHQGGIARSLLQSFDWRTLDVARRLAPQLRRVALVGTDTVEAGQPGGSPWLDGLDVDTFGGDIAAAAADRRVRADVLSPDYALLTGQLLASAHRHDEVVVPYTVDDVRSMLRLVDLGVDGLISDYPDRLRDVLGSLGFALPRRYPAR